MVELGTGPPVLFVPAPVSRYFIVDLLPDRSFAGHVARAGFDVFIIDFGTPGEEDRFADLEYFVDGRATPEWAHAVAIYPQRRSTRLSGQLATFTLHASCTPTCARLIVTGSTR